MSLLPLSDSLSSLLALFPLGSWVGTPAAAGNRALASGPLGMHHEVARGAAETRTGARIRQSGINPGAAPALGSAWGTRRSWATWWPGPAASGATTRAARFFHHLGVCGAGGDDRRHHAADSTCTRTPLTREGACHCTTSALHLIITTIVCSRFSRTVTVQCMHALGVPYSPTRCRARRAAQRIG